MLHRVVWVLLIATALVACRDMPLRGRRAPPPAEAPQPAPAPAPQPVGDGAPVQVPGQQYAVRSVDMLVLPDPARNKELQLRVTYPQAGGPLPVIVFSHGAWASKDDYRVLANHWAANGYVVIQPNHSDAGTLGGKPGPGAFRDWQNRPKDVHKILDSLSFVEGSIGDLAGKLDRSVIGVGGHSFGANTAQLVAGAHVTMPGGRKLSGFSDSRPRAYLLISPQGVGGQYREDAWRDMTSPVMTITGTNDKGREGSGWQWRTDPHRLSPPGDKYLLVLDKAYHDMGGVVGNNPLYEYPANDRQVALVKAASLAFWDAHVKNRASSEQVLASRRLIDESGAVAELESR
ncbi:MAG: alpha/beta fold hydrolase [Pseudomonadota bacterium]